MKISKTLINILHLMNNGWELGYSSGLRARYWLQKGGIGRGGEGKDIHGRTEMSILFKEGLVEDTKTHTYPTAHYRITEKGKQFLGGL